MNTKTTKNTGESVARDLIGRAIHSIEIEAKKRPYQVLGTAASIGYLFGQGWLRGIAKLGFAYLAQQAASQSLGGLGAGLTNQKRETIH